MAAGLQQCPWPQRRSLALGLLPSHLTVLRTRPRGPLPSPMLGGLYVCHPDGGSAGSGCRRAGFFFLGTLQDCAGFSETPWWVDPPTPILVGGGGPTPVCQFLLWRFSSEGIFPCNSPHPHPLHCLPCGTAGPGMEATVPSPRCLLWLLFGLTFSLGGRLLFETNRRSSKRSTPPLQLAVFATIL